MRSPLLPALFLAAALVAGCAQTAPIGSATVAAAPPTDAPGEARGDTDPVGTWDFTVRTPIGDQRGQLEISGPPDALRASLTAMNRTIPAQSATLTGDRLVVRYDDPQRGSSTVEARVRGDRLEGTLDISAVGTFPLTATRRPG